jgi:myo-inositol-1(or 4)-monophosphatase
MAEVEVDRVLQAHPLAPLAWDAARTAGEFLLTRRPSDLVVETKSSASDSVTQMDREAERILVTKVLDGRPQDSILGEEGAQVRGTSSVRWIFDPLDGTVNYLYRLPMWGVSVAAEVQEVLEVGVVDVPALQESFIGIRGHGAWHVKEDVAHPITMPQPPAHDMAMIATGFGYDPDRRRRQAEVVRELIPHVRDIRRLGACVVDMCWLALGRFDAYYERGMNPWDLAAGIVILREAGAVVSGLDTPEPSDDFILAACEPLHSELLKSLTKLGANRV